MIVYGKRVYAGCQLEVLLGVEYCRRLH